MASHSAQLASQALAAARGENPPHLQRNPQGKCFRFDPLKPAPGLAGEITVVCRETGKRAIWNDAARAGWVADLNGKAYAAYYSPEGRALATR